MINLRYYPANHEREFPEVVRVEHVASRFDAAEPFLPVVASVEVVDETMLNEG
jgi:hypothetical protein